MNDFLVVHPDDLAKAFYSSLFDWKLQDLLMPDGGSYTMIDIGKSTSGGMMDMPATDVPPHWLAYVGMDDVVAATGRDMAG